MSCCCVVFGRAISFRQVYLLVLLPLFCLLGRTSGTVLAESRLVICSQDGTVDYSSDPTGQAQPTDSLRTCNTKIILALALRGGQNGTETVRAEVKEVINGTRKETLKQPLRIILRKSEVEVRYNIFYQGSAWNAPSEQVVRRDHQKIGFIVNSPCLDGYWEDENRVACGFRFTNHNGRRQRIMYSQGYCCKCTASEQRGDQQYDRARDLVKCAVFGLGQAAAHCFDPDGEDQLKYDVFDVGPPFLVFTITLDVEVKVDAAQGGGWAPLSKITLSPSSPVGRAGNGRVLAEFLGDLLVPQSFYDLSYKAYLAPHYEDKFKDHLQVKGGPKEHMFVDKTFVDLSGLTCDSIGVSYQGFYKQPGRCFKPFGSCLDNQPSTFWKKDKERQRRGLPPLYFSSRVGQLSNKNRPISPTSRLLSYKFDLRHQSLVRLELDADSISFVSNVGPGVIERVSIPDFEALTSHGNLSVVIRNTGDITTDYTIITANCGLRIAEVPAKSLTLEPGQSGTRLFMIFTHDPRGNDYQCRVELYNQINELIDSKKVSFKTRDTCFCLGVCGCTCWDRGVKCPTFTPPRKKGFFERLYDRFIAFFSGKYGPLIAVGIVLGLGLVRSAITQLGVFRLNKNVAVENEEDEAVRLNRLLHLDMSGSPAVEEEPGPTRRQKVISGASSILFFFYAPILFVLRLLLAIVLAVKNAVIKTWELIQWLHVAWRRYQSRRLARRIASHSSMLLDRSRESVPLRQLDATGPPAQHSTDVVPISGVLADTDLAHLDAGDNPDDTVLTARGQSSEQQANVAQKDSVPSPAAPLLAKSNDSLQQTADEQSNAIDGSFSPENIVVSQGGDHRADTAAVASEEHAHQQHRYSDQTVQDNDIKDAPSPATPPHPELLNRLQKADKPLSAIDSSRGNEDLVVSHDHGHNSDTAEVNFASKDHAHQQSSESQAIQDNDVNDDVIASRHFEHNDVNAHVVPELTSQDALETPEEQPARVRGERPANTGSKSDTGSHEEIEYDAHLHSQASMTSAGDYSELDLCMEEESFL